MNTGEFTKSVLCEFPNISEDAKLDYTCGDIFSVADDIQIMKFCGIVADTDVPYQYIFNHMINNKHMYEWWCL